MFTAKHFEPQNFLTVNGATYFRTEDGKIAIESHDNPIIDLSQDVAVSLITIEFEEKTVRFWATEDKLYALAADSFVEISYHDIEFCDIYTLDNHPEVVYVKYQYFGTKKYGVIYVSETQVGIINNSGIGYEDIQFEDGTVYGEEGCIFYGKIENKYYTIDEVGKIIDVFEAERKRVSGYNMFYDESKIYLGDDSLEIPDKILSAQALKNGKMTIVRVLTPSGAYYFTVKMTFLFGPIKADQMVEDNETSCYIYVKQKENIVQAYHINLAKETYQWDSITCESGIIIYKLANGDRFFAVDRELYYVREYAKGFTSILKDVEASSYTIVERATEPGRQYDIVAFKEQKPIYWAYYCSRDKEVEAGGELEVICEGWIDGSYVCKLGSQIMYIAASGKILFSTTGQNCRKGKLKRVNQWGESRTDEVHIIEVEPDVIEIYDRKGDSI